MSPSDSAVRSYDEEAPAEPSVSENPTDNYDTTPEWSWSSSGEGDDVFRYRLNGGEWTILDGTIEPTTYTPPALFPGRYVLEVQERDNAGNWSTAGLFETVIKVREPEISSFYSPGETALSTTTPDIFTGPPSPPQVFYNTDGTPHFEWGIPAGHAQYGVNDGDRVVEYRVELERRNGDAFETVDAIDRTESASYSVASQLADGEYRFGVSTWSAGGAVSDPTRVTFIVDTTAPGAPSISGPSVVSDGAGATSFTITANSGDTVTGYDWRLLPAGGGAALASGGGQPSPLSIPLSTASSGPGKGTYTLEVRQIDSAGNVGAAATFTVTVEVIPTIVLVDATPTNNITPQFQVTGNDDGNLNNVFRWVIDGVPTGPTFSSPGAMTDTFTESIPAQPSTGTYTISVTVQQQRSSGGFSDASVAVAVTIDRDAPVAPPITAQPGSPSDGQNLEIQMNTTGEVGGQLSYSFSLGGTSLSGVTASGTVPIAGATTSVGPFTITNAASPTSTISVDFAMTDAVGNVGPDTTVLFDVDTTPAAVPTGADSGDLIGSAPNQATQNTTPTFTWNAVGEPGVTYEYSVDGGTSVVANGALTSATVSALAVGPYTFVVRSVDAVGNRSSFSAPISFEVVEPATGMITVTNPTSPTFNIAGGGPTLNRTASESWGLSVTPGSGVTITEYQWRVNGTVVGTAGTQTVAANDAATQLGTNTLTLVVRIDGAYYSDSFFFTVVN